MKSGIFKRLQVFHQFLPKFGIALLTLILFNTSTRPRAVTTNAARVAVAEVIKMKHTIANEDTPTANHWQTKTKKLKQHQQLISNSSCPSSSLCRRFSGCSRRRRCRRAETWRLARPGARGGAGISAGCQHQSHITLRERGRVVGDGILTGCWVTMVVAEGAEAGLAASMGAWC
jgi:hypothetical protein